MISREKTEQIIYQMFHELPGNRVAEDVALTPELAGMVMYDAPLVGFGSADDALFEAMKAEEAVGPWYMTPKEWYPEAKSVISIFFPLSEVVRNSGRSCTEEPSFQWLHARIEGQAYMISFVRQLCRRLSEQGIGCCVPGIDSRFEQIGLSSNWSERHAAYVCGLGTFGLSRGLITRRGIAGRFISVIVDAELPADERPYTGLYDYCIMCGACMARCPMNAISMEKYNDKPVCHTQIMAMKKKHAPRYGCGLCQTAVPCEDKIPKKKI